MAAAELYYLAEIISWENYGLGQSAWLYLHGPHLSHFIDTSKSLFTPLLSLSIWKAKHGSAW